MIICLSLTLHDLYTSNIKIYLDRLMNRKAVKKYIDKINALNNSILADEDYSEMETDLLESYTRFLLSAIVEGSNDSTVNSTEAKVEKTVSPPPAIPTTLEVKEEPSVLAEEIKEEVPSVAPVMAAPPKEEKPEPIEVVEEPTPAVQKPVVPAIKAEKKIPELEELFEFKAVTELSQRLSMQPIKDLTTAISINERMFTIQELFGGDKDKFQSSISKINEMASYDDAKTYLINGVAKENEWHSEGKQKKAAQFIILVKRRFSAN